MGILKNNTTKAIELEALKNKVIEEREKINEMRSQIEKKRDGLIADRKALTSGSQIKNNVISKKVDTVDLEHITSAGTVNTIEGLTDEIKKCDDALKVDPFYYTDYRKALIEYLNALEGYFDEKWLPLRAERVEIGKEVMRIEDWRKDCVKRQDETDVELDALLIEVGCNGAIFSSEHVAYDERKLFLARLLRIENEG